MTIKAVDVRGNTAHVAMSIEVGHCLVVVATIGTRATVSVFAPEGERMSTESADANTIMKALRRATRLNEIREATEED